MGLEVALRRPEMHFDVEYTVPQNDGCEGPVQSKLVEADSEETAIDLIRDEFPQARIVSCDITSDSYDDDDDDDDLDDELGDFEDDGEADDDIDDDDIDDDEDEEFDDE